MWRITHCRVNIPRCAAKIRIFSHINIKMLVKLFIFKFNVETGKESKSNNNSAADNWFLSDMRWRGFRRWKSSLLIWVWGFVLFHSLNTRVRKRQWRSGRKRVRKRTVQVRKRVRKSKSPNLQAGFPKSANQCYANEREHRAFTPSGSEILETSSRIRKDSSYRWAQNGRMEDYRWRIRGILW